MGLPVVFLLLIEKWKISHIKHEFCVGVMSENYMFFVAQFLTDSYVFVGKYTSLSKIDKLTNITSTNAKKKLKVTYYLILFLYFK